MNPSIRRAIWSMSDEDAKTLLDLARRHTRLVLEYGKGTTTPERKKAIQDEIEALRAQRDKIIDQYQN